MTRKLAVGLHIGHDRSVSVVEDGVLVAHLAQERIDRVKHSRSVAFPREALFSVLDSIGANIDDVGAFGLTYAFVQMDRILPGLAEELRHELGLGDVPVHGVGHHLAHAYSTFYTSPFENALVFVADGAGDLLDGDQLEAETAYRGGDDGLTPLWRRTQQIPASYADRRTFYRADYIPSCDRNKQISVARKYEQFTYSVGFSWGQCGKTMGLASYGTPLFNPPARAEDAVCGFDLRIADMVEEIEARRKDSGLAFNAFARKNDADLAATAQAAIEGVVLAMLRHLHTLHPVPDLCLAGGLFLNCVLNHKILERTPFRNLHIVPAAGDDGQSIGSALYAYKKTFGHLVRSSAATAYLGPNYSRTRIVSDLEAIGTRYELLDDGALTERMAAMLADGWVGGLLRGRSEAGPRALGHRSILAAPHVATMRDHLNRYVKHREPFRPFAPMVLWERQNDYFDLQAPSPFMLLSTRVREPFSEQLPAITHADGSARVQAVSFESDPFLHGLLQAMERRTGHPVLLNTSFNVAGEPIVETPRDAVSTFQRSNLDFLVLENALVLKPHVSGRR